MTYTSLTAANIALADASWEDYCRRIDAERPRVMTKTMFVEMQSDLICKVWCQLHTGLTPVVPSPGPSAATYPWAREYAPHE